MPNDGNEVIDVEAPSTRKRAEKTKRLFINGAGEKTPRAKLDSEAAEIQFVKTGEVLSFRYSDLSPEVARAAALWGVMTAVTNTIGRADMSDAEIFDAADARLDTILGGSWTTEAKSGPKDSDILEAGKRYQEEAGKEWTENTAAAMRAKLADESIDYRKTLLGNPRFKAHFEAVKAEKAAERAKRAQEAAGQSPSADLLDL